MNALDPPLLGIEEIHRRLQSLIPPALDPRGWARREMAARVVFVMLYGYAVEGEGRWIRPTAVTDMTDEQAEKQDEKERRAWLDQVQSPRRPKDIVGWYSENTREPIRDETLRKLIDLAAVVERGDLPTTSPRPRYSLAKDFARLFSSRLRGTDLDSALESWRESHLTRGELARVELIRQGLGREDRPLVKLPTGETRRLTAGPSSFLAAAVVESFCPRFLIEPGVLLISESAKKLTYQDRTLMERIGLEIDVSSTLPDVVLVDLGVPGLLIVFVECVVTDGEISQRRREELQALLDEGGLDTAQSAFITVFRDRSDPVFRRVASSLAWGTFAWFTSEPGHLLHLRKDAAEARGRLAEMIKHDRMR